MSCADSVTLGIKAEECPQLCLCPEVLRVQHVVRCQLLRNQWAALLLCRTLCHSCRSCSINIQGDCMQNTTSAYSRYKRDQDSRISQDQKFPLEPGPWEPPKQWSSSTHSSAGAKPYLPTQSTEKRGIFQQNKPLSQHTHTQFFSSSFSLETLRVTYRALPSSWPAWSEMQTDNKRERVSLSGPAEWWNLIARFIL